MTAWIVGYAIGLGLAAVVVVLLVLMIDGASRAAGKAEEVVAALDDSRANTLGLWQVDGTNQAATRIVGAATALREHLAAKGATS